MPTITTSDNIKLEYSSRGEGQPIVLIHGFAGEGSAFRVLDKLLSRSFNTIEIDLRGHGRSDSSEDVTIELLARDIYELIAGLRLKKPILAGWSMGGAVVFEFIKQYGFEDLLGIILIETSPRVMPAKGWQGSLLKGRYSKKDLEKDKKIMAMDWTSFAISFVNEMGPNLDEKSQELAIERISGNRPEVMSSVWGSLMEKDYRDLLPSVKIPSLVINGMESTFYDPNSGKKIAEKLPYGRFEPIEGAGHLVVMENPVALNRVIVEFINDVKLKYK